MLGTHTHVPTADARVLPEGTAAITDVGMTGSYHSVIGMKQEGALKRFLTGVSARLEVATESPTLSGVILDIDEATGKTRHIRRIEEVCVGHLA